MAALTFYRSNGEWGIEGVDLSTLPPKVYGALCKLHDLEHKEDVAIEHLAKMCGVSTEALNGFICFARHCSPLAPGPGGRGGRPVTYLPEGEVNRDVD